MYYNVCQNCGSNLDPGEHCDCGEKHENLFQDPSLDNGNALLVHDGLRLNGFRDADGGTKNIIRVGTPPAPDTETDGDTE